MPVIPAVQDAEATMIKSLRLGPGNRILASQPKIKESNEENFYLRKIQTLPNLSNDPLCADKFDLHSEINGHKTY